MSNQGKQIITAHAMYDNSLKIVHVIYKDKTIHHLYQFMNHLADDRRVIQQMSSSMMLIMKTDIDYNLQMNTFREHFKMSCAGRCAHKYMIKLW